MTEEEKPLTREEVLKMIEEHGGPEGLDLSRRNLESVDLSSPEEGPYLDMHGVVLDHANLQNADLSYANLQGARFQLANLQKADLSHANLQGVNLWYANLEEAKLWGADLRGAMLRGAQLQHADLRHCDLRGAETNVVEASLEGTRMYGSNFSGASIEGINWGRKYILGDEEEVEKETDRQKKRKLLGQAASVYRNLKRWHNEQGLYNLAGEFYFREMTVRRKALKRWPNPLPRAWSKFLAVLSGYGEKPWRVVASATVVVFGMALGIYLASALTFPSSLYHSAVSFTALGYGLGVSNVDGWVKAVGAAEAFMGVFMMALFLITFVRKMTR